jgi:hypothetical protein
MAYALLWLRRAVRCRTLHPFRLERIEVARQDASDPD